MPRKNKPKKGTGLGSGARHNAKVFKVTVVGRAEAGKSSLCMRFVANSRLRTYEHTTALQLYHREMDVRKLRPKLSGGKGMGAKKIGRSGGGRKKKRALVTYGLQIEDVPGEVSGAVEDNTIEKDTILRNHASASGYRQLLHDNSAWLGISPADEKTSLLGGANKRVVADAEKNVNLLYIPMKTDGYIVMFDVQSADSLSKARAIVTAIKKGPNGTAPIMLLGNKTDVGRAGAKIIRKAADFVAHSGGQGKRGRNKGGKGGPLSFAQGSVTTNTFQFEGETMDCYNLLNMFVQSLNVVGAGVESDEYESRFLRVKRGRGRGGGRNKSKGTASGPGADLNESASSGWGCCNCFAGGSNSGKDLEAGGAGGEDDDDDEEEEKSSCVVS